MIDDACIDLSWDANTNKIDGGGRQAGGISIADELSHSTTHACTRYLNPPGQIIEDPDKYGQISPLQIVYTILYIIA